MRVGGEEMAGRGVDVGEVAASAAGDQDFASDPGIVLEDEDAPAPFARFDGAHQSGRAGADDCYIEGRGRHSVSSLAEGKELGAEELRS
jgi:hypothetical protein